MRSRRGAETSWCMAGDTRAFLSTGAERAAPAGGLIPTTPRSVPMMANVKNQVPLPRMWLPPARVPSDTHLGCGSARTGAARTVARPSGLLNRPHGRHATRLSSRRGEPCPAKSPSGSWPEGLLEFACETLPAAARAVERLAGSAELQVL